MEDYMSEADNEVDGQYFADLDYFYEQKEIRRKEVEQNKIKKEENRKEQLIRQNKCIDNLKNKLEQKDQRIAELEQELAELKEKDIIPKFQLGQTIFTANKPNECIYELKIVSIHTERHTERSEFCDRKFNSLVYLAERIKDGYIGGYSEEDLFATEQEAQAKLKEIQGNE